MAPEKHLKKISYQYANQLRMF